jgi:uncharacterized protein YjiS (DUF1127 family)
MIQMVKEALARRRAYRTLFAELSQHSHRDLYDLHMSPGDIEAAARQGANDPAFLQRYHPNAA